jgi:L-lysine exporter family protein LysE/ArgO
MAAYFSGFLISLSLILAIGAQNAFVLRQGIRKQYVFIVCLICALSDALLILIGVIGFDEAVSNMQWIERFARYAGAAFLIVYGIRNFISAFTQSNVLELSSESAGSLKRVVLTCLMLTYLNPHVYLDTVIFLGSVSTQFEGQKIAFSMGSISASFIFFFTLGYGARILTPLFQKAIAWKILDFLTGLLMLVLAWAFLSL